MTICDILRLLEFSTDNLHLKFFFKLIFLHSKLPDVNVYAFQILNFEYTTNYNTNHVIDEIGIPKFSQKFDC